MITNPYSHCRRGPRADIRDGSISFRSAWEANYARYLEHRGKVWFYEPARFDFPVRHGPASFYIPDFRVVNISSGPDEYHEIKGYMNATSKAKLRRMRIHYPGVKVVLIDSTAYRAIEREYADIIPGWEGARPTEAVKERKATTGLSSLKRKKKVKKAA